VVFQRGTKTFFSTRLGRKRQLRESSRVQGRVGNAPGRVPAWQTESLLQGAGQTTGDDGPPHPESGSHEMSFARAQIDGVFVALAEIGADVVAEARLVSGETPQALPIAPQIDIGIEVVVA